MIAFDFATSRRLNINEAKIEGVESFVTARPAGWLEATLSHTWTDARDVTAGQPLGRVPKHKIPLSAVARPLEAGSLSPEVKIGRASDRGRVCQYVWNTVV